MSTTSGPDHATCPPRVMGKWKCAFKVGFSKLAYLSVKIAYPPTYQLHHHYHLYQENCNSQQQSFN